MKLEWDDEGVDVTCLNCGQRYAPGTVAAGEGQ